MLWTVIDVRIGAAPALGHPVLHGAAQPLVGEAQSTEISFPLAPPPDTPKASPPLLVPVSAR